MTEALKVNPEIRPVLDPGFVPAVLWNRAYRERVEVDPASRPLRIALTRPDGVCFLHETRVLPDRPENAALNRRYVERLVKFLLWMKGGSRILVGGCPDIAAMLADIYRKGGARAFDVDLVGRRMFLDDMTVESRPLDGLPPPRAPAMALGRHLDGCRIGFDLGGSDRKCASLIDGKVVHSEEVTWDPYFQKDPQYHIAGVRDTLRRAAAKLPRVDAIGGSSAGVFVNNEPRVASLFRGLSHDDFDRHIRPMFRTLQAEFGGVPFEVANDGEVTALAGSMSMNDNAVLGISLGTSTAAGYCDPDGHITVWLNELAFTPVDYRDDAPADEWSGDIGCGVQYFTQQGVNRLAEKAGIPLDPGRTLAERLKDVQALMEKDDPRARAVFESVGVCFGYAVAHYLDFYDIGHLLMLGRVTSGKGGDLVLAAARRVLREEFPGLADAVRLVVPDEASRRVGQAIAAASLPKR